MTPSNDTNTPVNAHHEADRGQIEPLIDNADTTQTDYLTSAELEDILDMGETGEFFVTFIEVLQAALVKNDIAEKTAINIVKKAVASISHAFTGESFYVSKKPVVLARQLAIYADVQIMPHYLVDKKHKVSRGYSLKLAKQIKAKLHQNRHKEQLAMTPHNHTTTTANAHHEADKGKIEPLTANTDTMPANNPISGKVIADKMRLTLTALHDNLTSLAHHAADLANNFPTMTNADFDVAISGLIGELWDSVEQSKELLPVPAQIYGQTLDVDFVNITNTAMQRFLEEHRITGNATGDSEPCNQ